MMPLYEILLTAQGGATLEMLAQRFGLSKDGARAVVEALLPAFSLGMKRVADTPEGRRRLMQLSGLEGYAPYYEGALSAMPQGVSDSGESILRTVFQSDRVKAAIAAKAAAEAGVGEAILLEMMPAIAQEVMKTITKEVRANPLLAAFLTTGKDAPAASHAAPEPPPSEPPEKEAAESAYGALLGTLVKNTQGFQATQISAWNDLLDQTMKAGSTVSGQPLSVFPFLDQKKS